MMDQFGNGHKDQYKIQYREETSQIHAPAALLERTRLAVAEEEKRLQAENVREEQNRNYGKRYRWAFSVAAAAVLLLAVHGFVMLRGVGAEDPAILQSAPAKTENSTSASGDPAEGTGGGRTGKTAESSSLNRDAVESMGDAGMDDRMDRYDEASGSGSENEMKELEKKYSEEDSASQISVTEVDRKPDFCNRPGTKRIVSQGITFYVTESTAAYGDGTADAARAEKDGWTAYAEYNEAKYVVTGEADDQEDFLEKVCEMLKEW